MLSAGSGAHGTPMRMPLPIAGHDEDAGRAVIVLTYVLGLAVAGFIAVTF